MSPSIQDLTKDLPDPEQQQLDDLSRRANGGMVIYPSVWFVTAFWTDMPELHSSFFLLNTIILLALSGIRMLHTFLKVRRRYKSPERMYGVLVLLILLAALHWGVLSAWIIFVGDHPNLHYPFMVILSAFALAGTSVLSVSRLISILYPLLIFLPTLAMGLIIGGTENYVMVLLAVISIVYIRTAAKTSHTDYHAAVFNHHLAVAKARELETLSLTEQLTGLNLSLIHL